MKTPLALLLMAIFSLFVGAEPTNLPPYLYRPTWDWIYGPAHLKRVGVPTQSSSPNIPSEPMIYGQRVRFWITPFGSQSPGSKDFYRYTPPFAPYWILRYESFATNEAALIESQAIIGAAFRRLKTASWFRREDLWQRIREEIASALKDPNPNVRWNAIFAIDPLYFDVRAGILILKPSLKDEDPRVRLAAVVKWNQLQKRRGGKTLPLNSPHASSDRLSTNSTRPTGR
ncbi:MAG: HEAT repeat domain-containing protein [Verrucomicrobiia bacterium]